MSESVSASFRPGPMAKMRGEELRARQGNVPVSFLKAG